jgi:hypothetical protein
MANRLKLPQKILNSKPMDWRWVPYDICKQLVNAAGIKSFRQYRKWVADYKPGGIPSRPETVYDEWTNWNEFLGTDNVYLADSHLAVNEKDLMPYWEAVGIIQKMRFENTQEYQEAFDRGEIPEGIPKRPHFRYGEFYKNGGYKNWLGKHIKHRVEAEKNIEPLLVIYQGGAQPNVLSIMIHRSGHVSLINELRDKKIKVVRIYHWYDEFAEHVFEILDHFGTKQDEKTWLFPNVNEVLFELSSVLEIFRIDK